jgi:hypothetical protein
MLHVPGKPGDHNGHGYFIPDVGILCKAYFLLIFLLILSACVKQFNASRSFVLFKTPDFDSKYYGCSVQRYRNYTLYVLDHSSL